MKRRTPIRDRAALSVEIEDLSKASIKDLRERWETVYGKAPCGHVGRTFLIWAIAYHRQEQAFGGLKPSTRRLLARVAEETAGGSSPTKSQNRRTQSSHVRKPLDRV